ncbi:MAG: hypothetical protein ACRDHO_07100, partial [Actinomycetota bacterium]
MDPIEYIRAVRRRWVLVVSAIGVAIALAWVTTSVAPVGTEAPPPRYQSTTVLLKTGGFAGDVANLDTLAAIATIPDISERVAEDIKYTAGEPASLGGQVQAVADTEAGLLNISATSTDPAFATKLADSFAAQLLGFLKDRIEATNATQAAALSKEITRLRTQISRL